MSLYGAPRVDWAATCDRCEWSRTLRSEQEAQIVSVLHVLVKHPILYQRTTGKDPDKAEYEYREMIKAWRSEL